MHHNLFYKHSNPLHLHRGIDIQYVVQFFYPPPADITGTPSFRFNECLIMYRTATNTELLRSSGDWNQVVSLQSPQNTGRLSRHNTGLPGLCMKTIRKKQYGFFVLLIQLVQVNRRRGWDKCPLIQLLPKWSFVLNWDEWGVCLSDWLIERIGDVRKLSCMTRHKPDRVVTDRDTGVTPGLWHKKLRASGLSNILILIIKSWY